MEEIAGTEVIELTGKDLAYSKEHVIHDDATLEVWSQGGRFKYRIRIGGNLGKRLSSKSKVRARKKT